MNAEIISIGTELLMGEIVDTNSAYLADELAKIGVELRWATKVGDHPARLQEAIERALGRSDITITTGGLGPTSDDLTRESIAAVMGEDMEVQDDLLAHLRSQFESRGVTMPATNIKQATLIPSAEVIPNPMGTAPGWWVEREGHVIAAMPGPPREISYMWDNQVGPRLRALNPEIVIVTRTLKTFGITEGGLDEMLSPLFQSENPALGIYSKQDGIHLRAIASASTESEAQSLIDPMEREIRKIAGHAIWGEDDDTPVSAALNALSERGLTLAVAEGFTGGLLSSTLLESASASGVFAGGVVITGGESDRLTLGVSVASPEQPAPRRRIRPGARGQGQDRRGRRPRHDAAGVRTDRRLRPGRNDAHRHSVGRRRIRPLRPLPHPPPANPRPRRNPRAAGTGPVCGYRGRRPRVAVGLGAARRSGR